MLVVPFVVVLLLEFFDDRMHGEKQIKALLGIPVVAEVPEIQSATDEQKQRRNLVLSWVFTAVVGCVIVLGSAYSYLRG